MCSFTSICASFPPKNKYTGRTFSVFQIPLFDSYFFQLVARGYYSLCPLSPPLFHKFAYCHFSSFLSQWGLSNSSQLSPSLFASGKQYGGLEFITRIIFAEKAIKHNTRTDSAPPKEKKRINLGHVSLRIRQTQDIKHWELMCAGWAKSVSPPSPIPHRAFWSCLKTMNSDRSKGYLGGLKGWGATFMIQANCPRGWYPDVVARIAYSQCKYPRFDTNWTSFKVNPVFFSMAPSSLQPVSISLFPHLCTRQVGFC